MLMVGDAWIKRAEAQPTEFDKRTIRHKILYIQTTRPAVRSITSSFRFPVFDGHPDTGRNVLQGKCDIEHMEYEY